MVVGCSVRDEFKKAVDRTLMQSRHCVQGSGWGWLAAKPSTGRLFLTTCPNQDALQVQHPVRSLPPSRSHWKTEKQNFGCIASHKPFIGHEAWGPSSAGSRQCLRD